ncbi:MAG: ribonucleotide reductase N-terminal alpha domain-containing protein [Desulfosarcinaceae bacterium]
METTDISPAMAEVLKKRYLARNYRGEVLEKPQDMFRRVAHAVAEADRLFEAGAHVEATAESFEAAMAEKVFLPNSPCLMNAGRPIGQLAACFVLPIEDSLESIFDTLKNTALIHQTGGGTGFSFSRLRPRGDTIFPAAGVAGGPHVFISLFDNATHLIDRNRVRPGANMAVLHVSHPDIGDFIQAKNIEGQLCNFNLSVAVDDLFIDCVKHGRDYPLIHPRTGVEVGRRSAPMLLDMMAQAAWKTGDPGLLFIDRINRANPTPGLGRLEATNPCGEQPLLPYECCTLGSINLTQVISGKKVDHDKLDNAVRLAVHFLDNVIEVNRYPLRQIEEISRTNRKTVDLAESIMAQIQQAADAASSELAAKRGSFPAFDHSIFPAAGIKRRRNATLTTLAPTGTISLIAGVSSGIEPVYAFETRRRIGDTVFDDIHPIYQRYRSEGRAVPKEIFQSAYDVTPRWHLEIQAAFQKHTDNAVSKTVNLPVSATEDDIRQLFVAAMDMPVKGITVYRDQSHKDQILGACSIKREECS